MDENTEGKRRTFTEEIEIAGSQLIERIKELVAAGNIRRLRVKTAEGTDPFLEIPLTGGVIGGGILILAAPWLAALGALAAIVAKVKIEIVREIDGDAEPVNPEAPPPAA
ncbi:MAG: DUF4342 domain-containing protein [Bauldia sp.]|nr:DUF4342 domain-containing protein [Bauldia sp.]MCW5777846.1 DUF4342 domain-containing protein [Phycisphaeraceae bacterium]